MYGSARDSYLQELDRVQNAALRVCLGAFRTTPIPSLHVEANELPLSLRRQKLALQYIVKLKTNPCNPAYASVFQTNYKLLFEAKPNAIPTLGIRMNQALEETGINLDCIAQHSFSTTPPWLLKPHKFNYLLYNIGIKSDTSPNTISLCITKSLTPARTTRRFSWMAYSKVVLSLCLLLL